MEKIWNNAKFIYTEFRNYFDASKNPWGSRIPYVNQHCEIVDNNGLPMFWSDFDIVSGVREKTEGVPVVMHGGSGVSKEDFHKAIKAGVRKINYFTYMDKAGGTATEEYVESVEKGKPVFYSSARAAAFAAMKENVKEAIKTFSMID